MSQQRQLAVNTIILSIGKAAGSLASFLLLPLYTIFLTPSQYGFVDLILTYIILFTPILTFQLEMATFRFLVDVRSDDEAKKKIVSNVLQIVLLTILILVVIYLVIASLFNLPYLWLILLNVVTAMISNISAQTARGFGENKKFASASIAAGATLLLTGSILIAGFNMGINGVLLATSAASIASTTSIFISLKLYRYISLTAKDIVLKKQLIGYSLPLIPNTVSWWIITVSDRTIVTIILGLTANGIYAVSNRFAAMFLAFYSVFEMSWGESASVHINAKNRDSFFSDVINTAFKVFGSLGLLLISVLPIIFPVVIGSQFKDAMNYIPILILAVLFNTIGGMYGSIYIAKKLTKKIMYSSIISALINISLNLLLIRFIGIYAAALSTAIAYLAMAIFRHFDIKKFLTITYEKGIFLTLAAAYALVISLYYFNNPIGNIVNILVTIGIVIVLNKSIISKVLNRLNK